MIRIGWISLLLAAVFLGAAALFARGRNLPGDLEKGTVSLLLPDEQTEPALPIGDLVTRVLARPLFNPSRRPMERSASDHTPGTNTTAPHQNAPRLAGIAVGRRGRSALFVRTEDGQSTLVGEGGRVGDELVIRIEPGKVTLKGPSGVREMRTVIDPSQPGLNITETNTQRQSLQPTNPSPRLGHPRQTGPLAVQPAEE